MVRKVSSCVNRSGFHEGVFVPFFNHRWYRIDDPNLPASPGVYGVVDSSNKTVIYVGQTDDLNRRIGEHRNDTRHCMHRYYPVWIVFESVADERTRLARERQLINEYRPPCNKV